jgi:conjugative transfer signal peptidase TraF
MRRTIIWIAWAALAAIPIALLTRAAAGHLPLALNYTRSLPVGFYATTAEKTAYAVFCLDPEVIAKGLAAGAEFDRGGSCPPAPGYQPYLKPIYRASAQHPITFSAQGFTIGGHLLPNTAPKPFSMAGKPLEHYPFGEYRDGIWVISTYTRDSFDSRYFGPIHALQIISYARPFLVLE